MNRKRSNGLQSVPAGTPPTSVAWYSRISKLQPQTEVCATIYGDFTQRKPVFDPPLSMAPRPRLPTKYREQ